MDIERLHRRMGLGILQPADFANLDMAYQNISSLIANPQIFEQTSELSKLKPTNRRVEKI